MEINLEVFEKFNQSVIHSPTIDSIIDCSIDVYKSLMDIEIISVYLFDKETFEPILKSNSNTETKRIETNLLDFVIEKGFIGNVMNSNDLIVEEYESKQLIIAPLISSKGALGFVIIATNENKNLINSDLQFSLKNFTGYLSSTLNGVMIENEGNYYKNKIDQLAAVQTRELLNTKKEISEKVEQLKSSLLMTLPHEVRTPLNQILGLTDYLKKSLDDTDKEEMEEILEDVHSSAVRLRRLFENYLYLSTLTINSYDIGQLEELQKSAIYSAESQIFETATNLSYVYKKEDAIEMNLIDSPLQISEEHFNKLIYELTDNAFKFGKEDVKIYIESKVENGKYTISIKDNGIGMPLEKIYMLDAYIQFDRMANEQQGSGLGLAIVKKILDIYNGNIKFNSELDKYTEITLNLPIADISDFDI